MEEIDLNTCCLGPVLRRFVCFRWNKGEIGWGSPNRSTQIIIPSLCKDVLCEQKTKLSDAMFF